MSDNRNEKTNRNLFSTNAELAVLSTLLKLPENIYNIKFLKPFMFSSTVNKTLFEIIHNMADNGLVPDINLLEATLNSEKKLNSIGGKEYLNHLIGLDFDATNFSEFQKLIIKSYKARSLLEMSNKIPHLVERNEEIDSTIAQIRNSLDSLSNNFGGSDTQLLADILQDAWKELDNRVKNPGISGIPTGLKSLDSITGGFQGGDLVIIASRPGVGKCLAKGTEILMYDGSLKNVEDVKAKDQLMGIDSKPRNVLSISSGKETMYWIRQNRGIDYRVNESHILSLKRSKNEWSRKHGEVLNISVRDIINKRGSSFFGRWKGYKTSVEFEGRDVPIDPYFFGLWLGDGRSSDQRIYTTDIEIVEYINGYADELGYKVSIGDLNRACPYYNITMKIRSRYNFIKSSLRSLNVLNNKHIPNIYAINSRKNRLKLLAGLIDSDGYCNGRNYEIVSKWKRLATQIKSLCDTLGYRTSIKYKVAKSQYGTEVNVWRVRFGGNTDEIPVKLPRKKSKIWTSNVDWQVTGIKIEKDKVDDYYGFTLDGDGLFLLGDMTVTHNTAIMCNCVLNNSRTGAKSLIFEHEMDKQSIVERFLAIDCGMPIINIRMGNLDNSELERINKMFLSYKELPIFLDTNFGSDMEYVKSTIRKYHKLHNINLVYIDYLQLLVPRTANMTMDLGAVSRDMKILATQLDISIILLSQLNRAVETRDDHRPNLSDLRQSGNLEEDADIVAMLYRDEMYNEDSDKKGVMEFIIRKHRNGPLGMFPLNFKKDTNKVTDM